MRTKIAVYALATSILLCACQANQPPERTGPVLETKGVEEPLDPGESASVPGNQLPPASPVCELDFTQTDSFPRPFEDELLVDEERGLLLSTQQALYDYDTMWLLLEENFPYLEVVKTEMGIDWKKVKENYRLKLEAQAVDGYISQEDFTNTFIRCLGEFQSVGHLFMTYPSLFLNSPVSDLDKNFFALVDNPKTESFYTYLQQCSLDAGSSNTESGDNKSETVIIEGPIRRITPTVRAGYVGDTIPHLIPYLKIASFSSWEEDTFAALAEFFADIADEDHLIIDVRGNVGGSDWNWRRGIVAPLAQTELDFDMLFSAKSGSLNLALDPTMIGDSRYGTRYTDDSWKKDFPYVPLEEADGLDIHIKCSSSYKKDNTQKYFNGKIWVLIDKYCYSATDAFVCFCKETGFATLVGTTTGGNGKGASPLIMVLPYSGLIVEYEPYLTFNLDGTCNGIKGTEPDIVPEEGRFALETCLQIIWTEQEINN